MNCHFLPPCHIMQSPAETRFRWTLHRHSLMNYYQLPVIKCMAAIETYIYMSSPACKCSGIVFTLDGKNATKGGAGKHLQQNPYYQIAKWINIMSASMIVYDIRQFKLTGTAGVHSASSRQFPAHSCQFTVKPRPNLPPKHDRAAGPTTAFQVSNCHDWTMARSRDRLGFSH